jgi:mono/diheme cytochrome c family protein
MPSRLKYFATSMVAEGRAGAPVLTRKWRRAMTAVPVAAFFLACWVGTGLAQAQPKGESVRGELLYSTHCVVCHSAQLHWRDHKAANNWTSLRAEVERWQRVSGLGWSGEDVREVARYLNARYYDFPEPQADRASTADSAKLSPAHR